MIQARHDLGKARLLRAGALGTPGNRTFRLEVEAERGSAFLWMEKEQLSSLALAIKKFLQETPEELTGPPPMEQPVRSAREPFFDFKIASLGLAHEKTAGMFAVLVHDLEDANSERATLLWWSPRAQIETMADEALEVVAAGRPLCVLCKQPMDPQGHMCPRSNGHKAGMEEI